MSEASKRTTFPSPLKTPKSILPRMPQKPRLWVSQGMVTFIVGEEEAKFVMHKHLADSSSTFFKTAFSSTFTEGQTQVMTLEDVEVEVFGLLMHWLYTHTIEYTVPNGRKENGGDQLVLLGKLYELAGRVLIPALQNKVIRHIRAHLLKTTPDARMAFIEYARDPDVDGTLKLLAVHIMAFVIPVDQLKDCARGLPEGMMLDLVMTLKNDSLEREKNGNRGLSHKSLPKVNSYFVKNLSV